MFTKAFWKGAGERCIKTIAQSALASLVIGNTITSFDWAAVGGIAATAGIASLLTSIISADFVAGDDNGGAA